MSMQRTIMGAFWASLALAAVTEAHVVDLQGRKLQLRHDECKPSTTTEYCTVTEKETVTVKETCTVTETETETEACTTGYVVSSLPCSETLSLEPTSTLSPTITTVTPEPTSTAIPSSSSAVSTPTSCPVPPSCGNLGFDWAYYNNSARNSDTTYSTFQPDSFKRTQPIYVGTTDYVGGLYQAAASGETAPIYDSTVDFKEDYFALNHHSYLYACETGTYTISIPYANDAVYVWLGAKAYAGWTDENADAKARYNQPDHIAGSASYQFTIPADTYVPIRFFYGQAQYGGGFSFNVTAPSGQVLVSNEAISSPYVVRHSCDEILAPQYPAFGSEI